MRSTTGFRSYIGLIALDVPTLVIDFRLDIYAFNSLTGLALNNLSKFDDIAIAYI